MTSAFRLSIELAIWTVAILLPLGIWLGRWLSMSRFRGRAWIEAMLLLPLVLPPTVIGYYLLISLSPSAPIGALVERLFGTPLVFSFPGLVFASILVNLPFAVQPVQQAFSVMPEDMRAAAAVSGLGAWRTFLLIELPLCWGGILGSAALVFAHTLGEFGVVLMIGGNIEGVTRTLAIAIYDDVQAFDLASAGASSLALVVFSLLTLLIVRVVAHRGASPR